MAGCKKRLEIQLQCDTALAWRIARFTLAGPKLKTLQHYLDEMKPKHEGSAVMEAVATFTTLASRGLVTIREVPKKGEDDAR
jgi:hypothetical protein